jgi:hypothetical protein
MNVSLQGARSKARLDWDRLEERRRVAQAVPVRIFLVAVAAFAAYLLWKYLAG